MSDGRQVGQLDRIKNLEIEAHKYAQPVWGHIFDKGAKEVQWRKDNLFNQWCWSNWTSTGLKVNPDLNLSPHSMSKWIMKTVKLLEGIRIEENLGSKNKQRVLRFDTKTMIRKKENLKQNFIEIENFHLACYSECINYEKIFANHKYKDK